MSVYIDNMNAGFGRMVMCHMSADTTEELLSMVDRIGVSRRWIQYPGTHREHFDVCIAKKRLAVSLGAEEVTTKELVRRNLRKREACLQTSPPAPRFKE